MKKTLLTLLTTLSLFASSVQSPEDVTYEWLTQVGDDDGGSEFVICLKEIFNTMKVKSFLEFGVGYSTKYLLDSCQRVLSIEVITNGYGPQKLRRFIEFYRDYSNWVPIAYFSGYRGDMSWAPYKYFGSDSVYKACSYTCATCLSYEPIDPFYLKEMDEFLSNLIKYNKIEVALIHPILFLRGDLVRLLFNKVPIIVGFHTAARMRGEENDVWGYGRLQVPDDYEEIYLPTSQGTTAWIAKKSSYQPLIENLKKAHL